MGSTVNELSPNATVVANLRARPYRWGIFQSIMSVVFGIWTLVLAYKYPEPWRAINLGIGLIHLLTCYGLANKRRYGLMLYCLLALGSCANYAKVTTIVLLRRHPPARLPLPSIFWLFLGASLAAYWLLPAFFYYPKRWNEFS